MLEVTCLVNEIVLHQNNDDLKSLVSEIWNSVLLDCRAHSTVCGMEWFKHYKNSDNKIKDLTDLETGRDFKL